MEHSGYQEGTKKMHRPFSGTVAAAVTATAAAAAAVEVIY